MKIYFINQNQSLVNNEKFSLYYASQTKHRLFFTRKTKNWHFLQPTKKSAQNQAQLFFSKSFFKKYCWTKDLVWRKLFISLSILSLLFCSSALLSLLMLQSEIHYNCTFYQKKIIIFFFLYFKPQKVWECIWFLVNMPTWMDQSRLCQFSVLPFPDRLHLEHCPDLWCRSNHRC